MLSPTLCTTLFLNFFVMWRTKYDAKVRRVHVLITYRPLTFRLYHILNVPAAMLQLCDTEW